MLPEASVSPSTQYPIPLVVMGVTAREGPPAEAGVKFKRTTPVLPAAMNWFGRVRSALKNGGKAPCRLLGGVGVGVGKPSTLLSSTSSSEVADVVPFSLRT